MPLSSMDSRKLLEVVKGQADSLDQGMDVTSGRRIENFSVQARRQLVVKLSLKGKKCERKPRHRHIFIFSRVFVSEC